ncbi:MAG: hypothetical protein V3T83_16045 [Acidobacteriota bacterium]
MADHDHSYKLLFSQAEMVAHLLRHLARREKWIAELDLSTPGTPASNSGGWGQSPSPPSLCGLFAAREISPIDQGLREFGPRKR